MGAFVSLSAGLAAVIGPAAIFFVYRIQEKRPDAAMGLIFGFVAMMLLENKFV